MQPRIGDVYHVESTDVYYVVIDHNVELRRWKVLRKNNSGQISVQQRFWRSGIPTYMTYLGNVVDSTPQ